MWWKIYFWIYGGLTIIGLFMYLGLIPWNLASWIEFTTSVIGVIGVYAFVFNRKIFNSMFWKVFFWLTVTSWVFDLGYALTPLKDMFSLPNYLETQTGIGIKGTVVSIIISIPIAYSLYQLGEGKTLGKTSKKKKK